MSIDDIKPYEEVCANCEYNTHDEECGEWSCGNEESDCYGLPTFYDDGCEFFEEKEN